MFSLRASSPFGGYREKYTRERHARRDATAWALGHFSNLLLIISLNNPFHMYLSDLRVYFKVEVYFRVT